jgi:hypothetical protein
MRTLAYRLMCYSGGRRDLHAAEAWFSGLSLLLSYCTSPPVLGLVCLVGPGVDFYLDSTPPKLWEELHFTSPHALSNGA